MTQELANKLIAWYEETIRLIKKDEKDCYKIIAARGVHYGVCYCSHKIFGIIMETNDFVIKHQDGMYWGGKRPERFNTLEENIQCLQLRIDILKTFAARAAFS